MRRFLSVFLAAAALAAPTPALAWGKTGHRTVAALADTRLSGLARAEIRKVLGSESLTEASNLPDTMRSEPDPFWQKTSVPWHWVTLNGVIYDHAPPEGDALTALAKFSATLRDPKASAAEKKVALRFVIHLVGDLHQPLHAGKCCDRGGNEVEVTWFGKPTNLHSLWDSMMVDDQQLSFTELAAQLDSHIGPAEETAWWDINPRDWASESAQVRETLYPPPGKGKEPPALGYDYGYKWTKVANQRLSKAGVRLAAYLNALYATPVQ